jgi:TPR repeat protein
VVKDVELEKSALKEAFAKTEEPLGLYFAGKLSDRREQFDFYKKSAEGGCSWGQVWYGMYFEYGEFVEKDKELHLEWMKKGANQNNPEALRWLGDWFRWKRGDLEQATSYYGAGAELGWKYLMDALAEMLKNGDGCAKDVRQAAIWGAKGCWYADVFWEIMEEGREAYGESGMMENVDCDFHQLCFALGWGLYWYQYGTEFYNERNDQVKTFADDCLDFYYSCVELQQKSIFTFMLFWNQTVGVKDVGIVIGKMVWEGREDNLVKEFGSGGN